MSSVKGKVQQKGHSRDNNSRNKTNSSGQLNGSTAGTKVSIDMSDMSSMGLAIPYFCQTHVFSSSM